MRKLVLILSFVISVMGMAFGQTGCLTHPQFALNGNFYGKYTGTTADTLTLTQDTIQGGYIVFTNAGVKTVIQANILRLDSSAADTIVVLNIYGRNFNNQTWISVSANNKSAVPTSTATTVPILVTLTTSAIYYRQFLIELIQIPKVWLPTCGSKIESVEIKVYN